MCMSFFLSVMPSKDLSPFSYISPQKTLFTMIKYALTIGVDEMRVKNITVSVPVRVNVTVRVSLV